MTEYQIEANTRRCALSGRELGLPVRRSGRDRRHVKRQKRGEHKHVFIVSREPGWFILKPKQRMDCTPKVRHA